MLRKAGTEIKSGFEPQLLPNVAVSGCRVPTNCMILHL